MEVLGVVGAVASIAQIVQLILLTGAGIVDFIDSVQDVPEDVCRLKLMLHSIGMKLEILKAALVEPSNESWLSPAICDSFKTCTLQVWNDVEAVSSHLKKYDAGLQNSSGLSLGKRLRYQMFDQKVVGRCVKRLESSEESLERIQSSIQL